MKKIYLDIDNDISDFEFINKYDINIDNCDGIKIFAQDDECFKILISDYDGMRESFKENSLLIGLSNDTDYGNYLKEYSNKSDVEYKEIFDDIEYVYIKSSMDKALKYVENNPELKNKKIVIDGSYNFNEEYSCLDSLKDLDYIYLETEGNNDAISLSDYYKTKNKLNEIVDYIKQFNFSPIEQVMFIYDLVRDRVYNKESSDESYSESRDITKILFGDKIVCLGYSKLFNLILDKLGFKTKIFYMERKDSKRGHARSLVYIKDDKYDICGVYLFDPTWDSKRSDNSYLDSYVCFSKTLDEISLYKKDIYKNITFSSYDKDLIGEIIEKVEIDELNDLSRDKVTTINEISRFIDGNSLINPLWTMPKDFKIPDYLVKDYDSVKIIDSLNRYDEMLNSSISADILVKVFYNVRKIEYYNEPDKYPFDINNILKIVLNSDWVFDTAVSRLMRAIFNDKINMKESTKKSLNEYIKDNDIELKIEQIKLCKTLRNVCNKKMSDK